MTSTETVCPIIHGAGGICSVGRGMAQIHASVRAGLGGSRATSIHDRHFEPMTLALLPEPELEPLAPSLESRAYTGRFRRMLRLGAPALREAVSSAPSATGASLPPLFLGVPEPRPGSPSLDEPEIVSAFSRQSGVAFDEAASRIFPCGRSAALLALKAGAQHLLDEKAEAVLVGGVDSHLDPGLLGELEAEGRILGPRVMDGFIPGEGAAFLVLRLPPAAAPEGQVARVTLLGVGTADDPGHLYASEPARGEGLSQAMEDLFASLPRAPTAVASVFAGFNGENFQAKEWGVARLRHTDRFSPAARMDHPADCFGDAGAALGALLLALAHAALVRGHRQGPALVFASSDREQRACALLDLVT